MTVADVRRERRMLQQDEDAVSFARRIVHGRLDIARAERERRRTGADPVEVEHRLAAVLGAERGGGSTRPPRSTDVSLDHPIVLELESLCEAVGFGAVTTLDDESLDAAIAALDEFERRCSALRRDLFDRIDALTAELVRRYRSGEASADSLLEEQ